MFSFKISRLFYQPEPLKIAPSGGEKMVAVGTAAGFGIGIPAAAAGNLAGTGGRAGRIDDLPGWIFAVPVLAPLLNIAEHVIEAPRVGGLATRRLRPASGLGTGDAGLFPQPVQSRALG